MPLITLLLCSVDMFFIGVMVLSLLIKDGYLLERKLLTQMEYEASCNNLTADPMFEDDLVVGSVWRIYYSWNTIIQEGCTDMTLKKASYAIKQRFKKIMSHHLETQPNWSNATLLMTVNVTHEMLLIPDDAYLREVPAGRFLGVPNIHKGGFIGPRAGEVQLVRLAMKLYENGKFLLVSDCLNGITSCLVRSDQKHTRGEIAAFVGTFDFGGVAGNPACKYRLKTKKRRLGDI